MNVIAQVIGKRIRERRLLLGLSQAQLAEAVGVDQTSVSQWERGLTCPSRRSEQLLLDALHARGTGMFDLPKLAAA